MIIPRRRRLVVLLVGLLAVVTLGSLPALGDGDEGSHEQEGRIAQDGSIIPEPVYSGPVEVVDSLEELRAIEKEIDPGGLSSTYACADVGDENVTIVQERFAPKDAKPDLDAGPLVEANDPCADKSMVVGK